MNPFYLMIPCAISASFAFMLPVATPPNAIVFAFGHMKIIDMVSRFCRAHPFPAKPEPASVATASSFAKCAILKVCVVSGEMWAVDEHSVHFGSDAGHQHLGLRLLWSGDRSRLGFGCVGANHPSCEHDSAQLHHVKKRDAGNTKTENLKLSQPNPHEHKRTNKNYVCCEVYSLPHCEMFKNLD